jgi:hypothetical protein
MFQCHLKCDKELHDQGEFNGSLTNGESPITERSIIDSVAKPATRRRRAGTIIFRTETLHCSFFKCLVFFALLGEMRDIQHSDDKM